MMLMAFLLGGLIGSAVMWFALRRDLLDQTATYQSGIEEIARELERVPTLPDRCAACGGEWRTTEMLARGKGGGK